MKSSDLPLPETLPEAVAEPKAPIANGRDAYWPQLDGLRAAAFIMVYLQHMGKLKGDFPAWAQPLIYTMESLLSWCWLSVDIFFALSGFLITHLLLAEKAQFGDISFKQFFCRRALRIWPLYYIVLLLALVAIPLGQSQPLNQPLYHEFLLKQGLPLFFFLGNYSLIFTNVLLHFVVGVSLPIVYLLVPLWSVAVEEQFYLTWPLLLKKLRTPKAMYITMAVFSVVSLISRGVLWYVSRYKSHVDFPVNVYVQPTISHMEPLMAGCALAVTLFYFPEKIEKLKPHANKLIMFLIAICGASMLIFPDRTYNTYMNIPALTVVSVGCLLLLIITLVSPTVSSFLSTKIMTLLGRLTYCMYLAHYFVMAIVAKELAKHWPSTDHETMAFWAVKMSVSALITFVIAYASWHLIERRILRLRKHFNRR